MFHSMTVNAKDGKSNELSVFFISDIHRRKIDEKLLRKLRKTGQFDLVIIGGDLVERGVPLSRVEQNVKLLSQLGPLFFVWGNNDREVGEPLLRDILGRHGCTILENCAVPVPGHSDWMICGTDDPSSRKVDIDSTLRYIDRDKYSILVTHTPSVFRKVEQQYKPCLMLAGHTHGGQIRLGRLALQEKGKFWLEGERAKLISNGYGTSTLPFRLGADPECHIIKIMYGDLQ
ncbi:metallophosphoesterase [Sporosarcina sp. 179-K 3D1 HS]|uniref:metallophosphoesterase n=1 Tax=Sporosarcina sp. 179-K 3D1 HS TaxID=3232169 RepID=UPI00399F3C4B